MRDTNKLTSCTFSLFVLKLLLKMEMMQYPEVRDPTPSVESSDLFRNISSGIMSASLPTKSIMPLLKELVAVPTENARYGFEVRDVNVSNDNGSTTDYVSPNGKGKVVIGYDSREKPFQCPRLLSLSNLIQSSDGHCFVSMGPMVSKDQCLDRRIELAEFSRRLQIKKCPSHKQIKQRWILNKVSQRFGGSISDLRSSCHYKNLNGSEITAWPVNMSFIVENNQLIIEAFSLIGVTLLPGLTVTFSNDLTLSCDLDPTQCPVIDPFSRASEQCALGQVRTIWFDRKTAEKTARALQFGSRDDNSLDAKLAYASVINFP